MIAPEFWLHELGHAMACFGYVQDEFKADDSDPDDNLANTQLVNSRCIQPMTLDKGGNEPVSDSVTFLGNAFGG